MKYALKHWFFWTLVLVFLKKYQTQLFLYWPLSLLTEHKWSLAPYSHLTHRKELYIITQLIYLKFIKLNRMNTSLNLYLGDLVSKRYNALPNIYFVLGFYNNYVYGLAAFLQNFGRRLVSEIPKFRNFT